MKLEISNFRFRLIIMSTTTCMLKFCSMEVYSWSCDIWKIDADISEKVQYPAPVSMTLSDLEGLFSLFETFPTPVYRGI